MNAVQQFSPSDKQDEICALTFKEQNRLLINVVWVRKVTFFYFFKAVFFSLSECCVYPAPELFTLLRFYYLLLLSAVLALQRWERVLGSGLVCASQAGL